MPFWFQAATFAVLGALLLIDLAVVARRPHAPSLRECSYWVGFYVSLALAFAAMLFFVADGATAGEFVAGWLTEYSLSVDNLFVFVLIMSQFKVPRGNQQKVLMMGIILSLILRGGFIVVGAAAIERFSWMFYVFGAFLVYTAIGLVRSSGEHESEFHENAVIRRLRRVLPISEKYEGARLVTRIDGRRMFTPMMIVFLAIGSTDLLFAIDSIPAIFGLTQDPFVVFTATLFALMGLRQLYFLLGGLLERLVYLSLGLAIILGFIGVKLVLEALHTNDLPFINGGKPLQVPGIPISVSLGVIVVVLAATTAVSLLSSRGRAHREERRAKGDVVDGPDAPAAQPSDASDDVVRGGDAPSAAPRPGAGPRGTAAPGRGARPGATGASAARRPASPKYH